MLSIKLFRFFSKGIPKPPNPTMPFGMIQNPPENLINPKSFIPENEKQNYEEIDPKDVSKDERPAILDENGNPLPKEVGFRYKGPEPTKFGDWAHKGRCTDF